LIRQKVVEASGVDFKLKDFRSTLTTITINGDLSRLGAMSAQLRHESPNTTHKFYNKIERSVASKKLKDLWKERPLIMSDALLLS
jgi:integrase/recombinase XerD